METTTNTPAIARLRARVATTDTNTLLDAAAQAFATRHLEESRILFAVVCNHLVKRLGLDLREAAGHPGTVAFLRSAAA